MAILLSGKEEAARVYERLTMRVNALKARGVTPGLAVILAGDDPGSQVYVRNKARACDKIGVFSRVIRLPATVTMEELLGAVDEINMDPAFDGLLVQLPLPKGLNEQAVINRIAPEKDVDGLHPLTEGLLLTGGKAALPCTPRGCMALIARSGVDLCGANAVVVGRSIMVGKPMALLLLRENATVTVCHSRTRDLAEVTKRADVLVAAVGKPGLITGDMVKPGAVVIDVGINRMADGSLKGDVDFDSAEKVAGYITPVPGGVGPMTIAMLMENTVEAAERRAQREGK